MRRRKWILIAVVLALSPAIAFGLDFSGGLKAGIAFPYWGGAGLDESLIIPQKDSKIMTFGFPGGVPPIRFCLTGGLFFTLGLFDFFAIQPEVLYTMTGSSWAEDDVTLYNHYSVIEVPILLKLRLLSKRGAGLSIFVGPDLQYIFALQTARAYPDGTEVVETTLYDFEAGLSPFVFGLVGGIGLQFGSGLLIEGRYFLGFLQTGSDFDWASITWDTFDPGSRTLLQNNIQVMIGFAFGSSRKEGD
jgi:hypothetical protein